MTVLITGATGFLGSHLVQRLHRRHHLVCLARPDADARSGRPSGRESFCMACFNGEYPMSVPIQMDKLALEPALGARDRHDFEWPELVPAPVQRQDPG